MKKTILLFLGLGLALLPSPLAGQSRKQMKTFHAWENYEVSTEKVGTDGTKFLKVWGFGRNADKAVAAAKRNAVHACLFRGLPASSDAEATPPICKSTSVLEVYPDYFETFFADQGPWRSYVNITTDGTPAGKDKRKVKGGYKVGVYVQVLYDRLKARLEEDGVVRRLSTGF